MPGTNVEALQTWFDSLERAEQVKVLEFLYGDNFVRVMLTEGLYCGPAPGSLGMVKKGLYCGPAPTSYNSSSDNHRCPTCLRPY